MRGRTNIPPRVGGIVNGIVREYQVAEENGIDVGDYVEFVASNSSHIRGFITRSTDKYTNDVKEDSTRLFQLSDGRYCIFSVIDRTTVMAQLFQETNGMFVEEQITLPNVTGKFATTHGKFACEIAEDKFLLLTLSTYNSYTGYILQYEALRFTVTELTISSTFDNIYAYSGVGMYKWSDDLYVIPTESNNSITVARLNESTRTLTFVSNLVLTSAENLHIVGKYNDYLVVQAVDVNVYTMYTISLSSTGDATLVKTETDASPRDGTYIKLNDNTFFCISSSFTLGSSKGTRDLTIAVTVVKVLSDGTLDKSTKFSKTYADCLYQRTAGSTGAVMNIAKFYHNGTIFGLASGVAKASGTTHYDVLKDLFSLPIDIFEDGSVLFGDITTQSLSYSDPSSTTPSSSGRYSRGPMQSNGTVCITTREALAYNEPVYIIKPSKEGLQNLYTADLVRKYSVKISGIAKTAGAKDEMIQVYSPH